MDHCDILIIGGGAAGIAAAKAAFHAGCRRILLADRRAALGGVLGQCAHHGFGAGLSGPEYTEILTEDFPEEVVLWQRATVTEVRKDRTAKILGPEIGERTVSFQQLILATGCRETHIGALSIPGTRPSGIFTAGQMQEQINRYGFHPEGPVVILGSGDLGLILARQLAQMGLCVTLVEQKDRCGGMARNQKCLEMSHIRLRCRVTIAEVLGLPQVECVRLTDGTILPCKTLLTAVGLKPEREVIRGLEEMPWLHLCGNCRKVHPMIETVIQEAARTGTAAWEQIQNRQ